MISDDEGKSKDGSMTKSGRQNRNHTRRLLSDHEATRPVHQPANPCLSPPAGRPMPQRPGHKGHTVGSQAHGRPLPWQGLQPTTQPVTRSSHGHVPPRRAQRGSLSPSDSINTHSPREGSNPREQDQI